MTYARLHRGVLSLHREALQRVQQTSYSQVFSPKPNSKGVRTMASTSQPITVLGAGVLGLSAATTLQKRHPNTKITVIAAEVPSLPSTWPSKGRPSADYASMWAGAHFRPIPRSTRQLEEEADMTFTTAKIMYDIADNVPETEAGVARMPAKEYLENPPEAYSTLKTGIPFAGPGDQFRVLDKDELPTGVQMGCEYQAYCVNVHVYCSWLLKNFLARGGKLIQKQLTSLNAAFDHTEDGGIVVNCSGRNFDSDPRMEVIRGQTVLVKNQYHSTITRQNGDGSWIFLIPRPGGAGTIVGGTKEIGDMETEARPEVRQQLLAGAVKAFPDFVDEVSKFEVLTDNVGRRPWREGGLRIETEVLQDSRTVIHGYGAGGRGYEISWGVAEQIADLYDQTS